jgi:hypothetical protein
MKYLKTFEKSIQNYQGSCWKVTSKRPDFFIALDKIGVPKDIRDWLDEKTLRVNFIKNDIVIIHKKDIKNDRYYWTWAELQSAENMIEYYKTYYNYHGEVKATPEEIELWNDLNKYNL